MGSTKGFTLIELLIAIVIIGILAAIVTPNFISVKTRSFDSAAKADIRNMITAQENYFAEVQSYADLVVAAGARGDLDGNGTEDFRASAGVSLQITAYTDGFQITGKHQSSSNTWCVNSSGTGTGSVGAIVKATSC